MCSIISGVIRNVQFTIALFQLCVISALGTVYPPQVPACRDAVMKIMLAWPKFKNVPETSCAQQALWRLARGGRTVISTIHQPRSSIFAMFDLLLLMSEGQLLFYGPAHLAVGTHADTLPWTPVVS